jgi:2-iminobutanoate/2-iminopropanoate deaminase
MELWGAVNAKYAEVMGDHRPARAIVPVKDLHFGTKIEIQAIAASSAEADA